MNDRYNTPRIYDYGLHKRELKLEPNKQTAGVISQIPKLTNYFSSYFPQDSRKCFEKCN